MKKFLILLLLIGGLPSILYSQSDSLVCLTVKQQNDAIAKLVHRLELISENKKLIRLDKKNDSLIAIQANDIAILKDEKYLLALAYDNKKKALETSEEALIKESKRKRFWRGSTVMVGIVGTVLYLLK